MLRRKDCTGQQANAAANGGPEFQAEATVDYVDGKRVEGPAKPPTPPELAHFVRRDVGLGRVVAITQQNPFPGTSLDWGWIFNAVGPDRYSWISRHGISFEQQNDDFWNFLIPGVGLAPVGAYRILITLFVIAIGPVNYFLLRKWRRLHLLLFTVPASAAVITSLLIAYALAADGFAVRVRARSITQLDQRVGQAATWSRFRITRGWPLPAE